MVMKPLLDQPTARPTDSLLPSPASHPRAVYAVLPSASASGALARCPRVDGGPSTMPFEWTLNPYLGCELACAYCSARTTLNSRGTEDPLEFERSILGREDLPIHLAKDLESRVAPGQRIAVGTATDPYQPFEREREITRHCLRVFARHEGLRLSITTKSDLVLRDLDLLRVIAHRSALHVNITLTTLDRRLAAALEPRAPTPTRRLRALRTLAAEGIETGVFLMPVLPGLTDGPRMIEDVAGAASFAGAGYLSHRVLFLRDPMRSFWFDRLREKWPALVGRYRRWYAIGDHAPPDLLAAVARRVARARRRHGLDDGPTDRAPANPQLALPFGG